MSAPVGQRVAVERDRNGFEILTHADCLRLLATVKVGRVGVSMDALPVILPVNFAVDGDSVVFRTNPGTKLDAAVAGCVVCFEADNADESGDAGWSVVVTGRAGVAGDTSRLEELGVPDLLAESGWIRIPADVVSGRRRGEVLDLTDRTVVGAIAAVAERLGPQGLAAWLDARLTGLAWRPLDLLAAGDVQTFARTAAAAAASAAPGREGVAEQPSGPGARASTATARVPSPCVPARTGQPMRGRDLRPL